MNDKKEKRDYKVSNTIYPNKCINYNYREIKE
jgi:hypothetical protein